VHVGVGVGVRQSEGEVDGVRMRGDGVKERERGDGERKWERGQG
jgi:hypothetical protein